MKGYVSFYVDEVSDPAALKRYQATALPTLGEHGGRVISAYGRQEPVEGEPIMGVVLVEFASYPAAQAWYHSAGYQAAKALRVGGVKCRAVIFEGRAPPNP
jgi:uncharacterized protein (DUF1330 family)